MIVSEAKRLTPGAQDVNLGNPGFGFLKLISCVERCCFEELS